MKGKNKNGPITRRSVFVSEDPTAVPAELNNIKRRTNRQPENAREFCSYFYARKKNIDPYYHVTSHAASSQESVKKAHNRNVREQVFSTYPCLGPGLRWSPSIDSLSEDIQEEEEFICRRCRNCKETIAPERRAFKDNIMKFSDNSTMTLNVKDTACEMPHPHVEAAYSSTVSISSSNIAVRDEPEPQVRFSRSPILKKIDHTTSFSPRYIDSQQNPMETSEAAEGIDSYTYMESCPKTRRARLPTCPNLNQILDESSNPRKNIYNEGISDAIANNFPNYYPLGTRLQVQGRKRDNSRPSIFSKNVEIPFTHQGRSKYHHECKIENKKKPLFGIQEEVRLAAKPKALRTCHPAGLERCELAPYVKMPRKVLSSEQDIDSYIRNQSQKPKFL